MLLLLLLLANVAVMFCDWQLLLVVCCPYARNLCSCVIKTNTSGKNLVCGCVCVCVFPLRTFMSLLHCSATTPPPRAFSSAVVVDEDDVADAFPCSLTKWHWRLLCATSNEMSDCSFTCSWRLSLSWSDKACYDMIWFMLSSLSIPPVFAAWSGCCRCVHCRSTAGRWLY